MNMIKADEEHLKKIYIYLVDGSRYSIEPLNNKLVEYVTGSNIISIEILEHEE